MPPEGTAVGVGSSTTTIDVAVGVTVVVAVSVGRGVDVGLRKTVGVLVAEGVRVAVAVAVAGNWTARVVGVEVGGRGVAVSVGEGGTGVSVGVGGTGVGVTVGGSGVGVDVGTSTNTRSKFLFTELLWYMSEVLDLTLFKKNSIVIPTRSGSCGSTTRFRYLSPSISARGDSYSPILAMRTAPSGTVAPAMMIEPK